MAPIKARSSISMLIRTPVPLLGTRSNEPGSPSSSSPEPLAAVLHDVRNMLSTLKLYGDLLAEPGVLAAGKEHFVEELQLVAKTGSSLLERLEGLHAPLPELESAHFAPIRDLAAAVQSLAGPLSRLAGKEIDLQIECLSCPGRVQLSKEDLTRILINLTRNAAEAMPQGGRIRVTLQQGDGGNFFTSRAVPRTALLCVQDSGPGIPLERMCHVFEEGFSTKTGHASRGLGLSIVRRLVEAAGGFVRAVPAPGGGARLEMELPLITPEEPKNGFLTDFPEGACIQCQ